MTLPANLPINFRTAAHQFADDLRANFASGIPAQAEDQLKAPVQALLRAVAGNVITRTEAQLYQIGGRPDIGVSVHGTMRLRRVESARYGCTDAPVHRTGQTPMGEV